MESKEPTRRYYDQLLKPSWAPKPPVFMWVWSILYPMIIGVNIWAIVRWRAGIIPGEIVAVLAINAIANILFTPIQFGLKNNRLALLDICIVLITVVAAIFLIMPYAWPAAALLVPYAVWVGIATILQTQVTRLNESKS
jgi:tryptophan-rich sensory protein